MIPSTSSTSTLTSVPDPTPNRERRKGPDMRKHSRDKWSKPKLHALLLSCLEMFRSQNSSVRPKQHWNRCNQKRHQDESAAIL
jgi:hypothetical protein